MPKNSMTRNSTARNSTLAPNVVEPTRHADVYGHGTCPVSQTGQDMGDELATCREGSVPVYSLADATLRGSVRSSRSPHNIVDAERGRYSSPTSRRSVRSGSSGSSWLSGLDLLGSGRSVRHFEFSRPTGHTTAAAGSCHSGNVETSNAHSVAASRRSQRSFADNRSVAVPIEAFGLVHRMTDALLQVAQQSRDDAVSRERLLLQQQQLLLRDVNEQAERDRVRAAEKEREDKTLANEKEKRMIEKEMKEKELAEREKTRLAEELERERIRAIEVAERQKDREQKRMEGESQERIKVLELAERERGRIADLVDKDKARVMEEAERERIRAAETLERNVKEERDRAKKEQEKEINLNKQLAEEKKRSALLEAELRKQADRTKLEAELVQEKGKVVELTELLGQQTGRDSTLQFKNVEAMPTLDFSSESDKSPAGLPELKANEALGFSSLGSRFQPSLAQELYRTDVVDSRSQVNKPSMEAAALRLNTYSLTDASQVKFKVTASTAEPCSPQPQQLITTAGVDIPQGQPSGLTQSLLTSLPSDLLVTGNTDVKGITQLPAPAPPKYILTHQTGEPSHIPPPASQVVSVPVMQAINTQIASVSLTSPNKEMGHKSPHITLSEANPVVLSSISKVGLQKSHAIGVNPTTQLVDVGVQPTSRVMQPVTITTAATAPATTVTTSASASANGAGQSVVIVRQLQTPKPYSGQTSHRSFREHFERVAKANCWVSELEKMQQLALALEGPAIDCLKEIKEDEPGAYAKTWEILARRFGHLDEPERAMRRFDARRQMDGESVAEFEQSLRTLYREAWPRVDEVTKDSALKRRFEEGLSNPEMLQFLRLHARGDDFSQTVAKARRFAETQEAVRPKKAVRILETVEREHHTSDAGPQCSTNFQPLLDGFERVVQAALQNQTTTLNCMTSVPAPPGVRRSGSRERRQSYSRSPSPAARNRDHDGQRLDARQDDSRVGSGHSRPAQNETTTYRPRNNSSGGGNVDNRPCQSGSSGSYNGGYRERGYSPGSRNNSRPSTPRSVGSNQSSRGSCNNSAPPRENSGQRQWRPYSTRPQQNWGNNYSSGGRGYQQGQDRPPSRYWQPRPSNLGQGQGQTQSQGQGQSPSGSGTGSAGPPSFGPRRPGTPGCRVCGNPGCHSQLHTDSGERLCRICRRLGCWSSNHWGPGQDQSPPPNLEMSYQTDSRPPSRTGSQSSGNASRGPELGARTPSSNQSRPPSQ